MWFKAFLKVGYGAAFLDYLASFYSDLILNYGLAHVRVPGPTHSPKPKTARQRLPL